MTTTLRLDDLYKMVAQIYSEQNAQRPASATLAHFVEVCGMLAVHDREKKREEVTFVDALCKALGWYFPLMAKFGVRSVEDLVFRKYPRVCPYCRLQTHKEENCKQVLGTKATVDHEALRLKYEENKDKKPGTLDEWQGMFQTVYPRSVKNGRSSLGLMEELGELAEAIRVFDRYPKYFAGEAADVFSYLMGFANEHSLRLLRDESKLFSFEQEFIKRYPGLCVECGSTTCVCPLVPESTVGRLAKELDVARVDELFGFDPQVFREEGTAIGRAALARVGGYAALIERFPFDRGEANKALVLFCLKVADMVEEENEEAAHRIRSAAVRIGAAATYAGSRNRPAEVKQEVEGLTNLISELGTPVEKVIAPTDPSLPGQVGRILNVKVRRAAVEVDVSGSGPTEVAAVAEQMIRNLPAESPSGARKQNPWLSGSFYLAAFVVVVSIILVAAERLSPWVLPIVIVGAILGLSVVGALQLRQDQSLSEQSFLSLMNLALKRTPLLIKGQSKTRD